jgi:hypothetical protein
MNAIVDAVTGKIYSPPISEGFALPIISPGDPDPCPQWGPAIAEFRLNSNLMIVSANPGLKEEGNYRHYFLWENNRWKLLRRVPMAPCEPPKTHPNPDH